jgi:hypothetical protein
VPLFTRFYGVVFALALLPSILKAGDVLPRWQSHFPALNALTEELGLGLYEMTSPHAPLPDADPAFIVRATAIVARFDLAVGEELILPPISGPESPFPDHQPLREVIGLRVWLARHALAAGNAPRAVKHVRQALAQSRTLLGSQEGLIALIQTMGMWQTALDGVHALALSPLLSDPDAHALLRELKADADLSRLAGARAFQGEYTYVYKVVAERLPQTDDPDLLLSSIGNLGMAPPEPLPPGELGLGLSTHLLLDLPATLAAYQADLAPYLAHLATSSRLPRGLYASGTARTLVKYRDELGKFFPYSCGELPPTLAETTLARAAMESTANPGGKLLAIFLTPQWETLLVNSARREAQRSALCGLLAWRLHGGPAPWEILVARGLLPAAPADPFSTASLRYSLGANPRIWSVFADGRDDGGVLVDSNSGQPADLVWPALAD